VLNIENFKLARKWVDQMAHFDMADWLYIHEDTPSLNGHDNLTEALRDGSIKPCGTVGCLGGTIEANLAYHNMIEYYRYDDGNDDDCNVDEFLGITDTEAHQLFYNARNYYSKKSLDDVTKEEVLSKLDEIIATGEFNGRSFDKEYLTNPDFEFWHNRLVCETEKLNISFEDDYSLDTYIAGKKLEEVIKNLQWQKDNYDSIDAIFDSAESDSA